MAELEIAGLGVWSPYFSNWQEFCLGINTGVWQTETRLQPELIPARERRRAPQSVTLAVEVMSQASQMAGIDPVKAAAVFSSSMGDMQITDYMCRTLAASPRLVSPTRFHNSVHNAATGYWSIVSHSHAATNAVSAYDYTVPIAFLEAAIQALDEDLPVLLVMQEMTAPLPLHYSCPSDQAFSSAVLLTPKGYCSNPVASIGFSVAGESVDWPAFPTNLRQNLAGNFGARLLPVLGALATRGFEKSTAPIELEFPLNAYSCLRLCASALNMPGLENA